MSTAGWASCLDSFADHLEQQRRALAEGAPERIETFLPSGDLGPLPVALLPRARELHAQSERLTGAIEANLTHARTALQQLDQPSEGRRSSYVDSMA